MLGGTSHRGIPLAGLQLLYPGKSVLYFFRLLLWATPPLLSSDLSSFLLKVISLPTIDSTLFRVRRTLSSFALQSLFTAQQLFLFIFIGFVLRNISVSS